MPILFKDPNHIEGEMSFDELFRHMSGLARRKITQRTFEVFRHSTKYLGIGFVIGVIVRAEFTYSGMNILSDKQGRTIKWVILSPYDNGYSINDFLTTHSINKSNSYHPITPFLSKDTHEHRQEHFYTLQDQVHFIHKYAVRQIKQWKHLLPRTRQILNVVLGKLGTYYERLIEYGDLTHAEALRRKLDILSEVDPHRKQETVWKNHST